MDLSLVAILLLLQNALYTHQARTRNEQPSSSQASPPQQITAAETSNHGEDSFVNLVKSRPGKNQHTAHKQYKVDFANHPEIMKLRSLSHNLEDYTDHALYVQSKLADEDGKVKVKFTKAIQAHMADTNVFTEKERIKIKALLRQSTKRQYKEKQREIKYGRKDAKVIKRSKAGKSRTPQVIEADQRDFEQMLREDAGVTDQSTASDVEEASRPLIQSNYLDTRKLKKYLESRYPPHKVQSAIASRSMYLGQQDVKNQSRKRSAAKRAALNPADHGNEQRTAATKSCKTSRKRKKQDGPSTAPPSETSKVTTNDFEDSPWWNDCFS